MLFSRLPFATVTITQIKVTLQLNINIWVPAGVTQHVIEHEGGHRQVWVCVGAWPPAFDPPRG